MGRLAPALPMYQYGDKSLVVAYLNEVYIPQHRIESSGITVHDLDLPFPVWSALRAAYYDAAVNWRRKQAGLGSKGE